MEYGFYWHTLYSGPGTGPSEKVIHGSLEKMYPTPKFTAIAKNLFVKNFWVLIKIMTIVFKIAA